jgi:NADH-quinone oxidoreductase subunit J
MSNLSPDFLFYSFSGILVFSAATVVVAQHAVFALLFLILSFLCSTFLIFLLECEFLALIFLIVYVGAIAVLFLFAVMMLNTKLQDLSRNLLKYLPAGLVFGLSFFIPVFYQISNSFKSFVLKNSQTIYNIGWFDLVDSISEMESYGQILYSYFILQFLIVGLILLLVLIGIVYLINTFNAKQTTNQSTFKQLSVKSSFFSK